MANSSMGELIFFMRGNKVKSKRNLEIVRSKIRDEFQKELDRPRRKRFVLNFSIVERLRTVDSDRRLGPETRTADSDP